YTEFVGVPNLAVFAPVALVYPLAIAFLMVSKLPVHSGKKIGTRVPPDMVPPVFLMVVLVVALLLSYPWAVLTLGTLAYLATLPFGWLSYRDYERRDAEAAAAAHPATAAAAASADPLPPPQQTEDERPARLN